MATRESINPTGRLAADQTTQRSEGAIREAIQITVLLHWITRAQSVLNEISLAAQINPAFEAKLREFNIRYHLPLESDESEAVSALFYSLRDRIEDIVPGASHG